MKRSLPVGNGWKACSVVITAGEYIRLSLKRKFGKNRGREALPVEKSAKQNKSRRC